MQNKLFNGNIEFDFICNDILNGNYEPKDQGQVV